MMRLKLAVLLLCLPVALIAQTAIAPSQLPSALFQQMVAAGGWSRAALPADAVVTASMTILPTSDSPTKKEITFKSRGSSQFRWEYSDAPGKVSVSDLSIGGATGAMGLAPSVQAAQPWLLPFLGRLQEFANTDAKAEYLGTEFLSEPTYKVRVSRVPSASDPRGDEVVAGSQMTVWLSTKTFLPVQIAYLDQSYSNRLSFFPRTRTYRDYRVIQGVMVPFHQEVLAEGELLYTLDLKTVQFNVGVSVTDFQIQNTAGGR